MWQKDPPRVDRGGVAQSPTSPRQATEPALRTDEAPAPPPTCRLEASLGSPDSKGGSHPRLWLSLAAPGWGGGPAASEGWG